MNKSEIAWTPIEDRNLLKVGYEYLVSTVYDYVMLATYFELDGRYAFEEVQYNEVLELEEVTAWAELPEPYRKE